MYESTAILKGEPVSTFDEYGNEIVERESSTVFVKPRSVYASEFYAAAQLGIHPAIVLKLGNRADYNGQKIAEYEGKEYEIIRADWRNGSDALEITLAERVGLNVC